MPYNPYFAPEVGGHEYESQTWHERLVHQHTGLNFAEIEELDYIDWLGLRRDAFLCALNQTEAGREYLDGAWRLEKTEPDRDALRRRFGRRKDDAMNE